MDPYRRPGRALSAGPRGWTADGAGECSSAGYPPGAGAGPGNRTRVASPGDHSGTCVRAAAGPRWRVATAARRPARTAGESASGRLPISTREPPAGPGGRPLEPLAIRLDKYTDLGNYPLTGEEGVPYFA